MRYCELYLKYTLQVKSYLKRVSKTSYKYLDLIDRITDEYSDTIALFMITAGSLLAAVAIGGLPQGGNTIGYSFIYLKHPIWLHLGLVALVIGFTLQFSDSLLKTHKLSGQKVVWLISIVTVYFFVIALFG